MPTLKNHPHKYALDLFKLAIDRIPVVAPKELIEQAHKDFEAMSANPSVSGEAIDDVNTKLGRAMWPYLKAYDELYAKYGKQKEDEVFLETLRPDVKEHYQKWNHAKSLEDEFAPEEKFVIEEARLDAVEAARGEVDVMLQGEKRAEYDAALKVWMDRQKEILDRLDVLRRMAAESDKWGPEINGKIRAFEAGWAPTEKDPELYEVEKEIENWRGVLEVSE